MTIWRRLESWPFFFLFFGRIQRPLLKKEEREARRSDFQNERLLRLYLSSLRPASKARELFKDVKVYCMFLSYPQSRQTLIGALFDAHRSMNIAHEVDTLGLVQAGFGRDQIFYYLMENSIRFAGCGREWSGHSFAVPGQWQGKFERLKVIGDKKGSRSLERLRENGKLLERLKETVGVPVRHIHYIRNPYDN
ncbi:MAG: hypothetical protein ACREH5_01190, partial [Candidatus Omnitrophota bacterium]